MLNNEVETGLLIHLKQILNTAELKTYEKMIMVVIKVFQAEYEDAFPDYDTIAAAGGMCKRKAQYVVKDLVSRNLIEIKPRFKELANGSKQQKSNQYLSADSSMHSEIQNLHPVHATDAPENKTYAPCAPYKEGFDLQDTFKAYTSTSKPKKIDDDESRTRTSVPTKYACYADVYAKMIEHQGTGVLCYHQEEFLDCCVHFGLPHSLVTEIYKHTDVAIQRYHYDAIYRSLLKFTEGLAKKKIANPIAWFVTTFRNEDLKVRTEIQMGYTQNVS